jgi:hypothetical protein
MPMHEIDSKLFEEEDKSKQGEGQDVLTTGTRGKVVKWQEEGAIGHWEIMRTVIPSEVWENW